MSAIDQAFNSLFFGAGMWLGLLLFIVIVVGLIRKWKYSAALIVPLSVMMALEYYKKVETIQECVWGFVTMLFLTIFSLLYFFVGKDDR